MPSLDHLETSLLQLDHQVELVDLFVCLQVMVLKALVAMSASHLEAVRVESVDV